MLNNSVTMVTTMTSTTPNNRNNNQLRGDASPFSSSSSSYLSCNIGQKKLAESSSGRHHNQKEEDGQIGVFEAQKYFNGGMDLESPRLANLAARQFHQYQYHQKDEEECIDTRKFSKIHYGTPSVRSESSWNSQSKLLKNNNNNAQRIIINSSVNNKKSKVQGKSFLSSLGCKCSCTDKNSVDISNHNKTPTTYGVVVRGEKTPKHADYLAKAINKPHENLLFNKDVAFSTVNSGLESMKLQQQKEEEEEVEEKKPPRKSLEVFGSPILSSRRSLTFDKRLTTKMPTWDAAAAIADTKMEEIDLSAASGNYYYNDSESDASSDLFEIDSLTGKSNHQFLTRQASDVASGCASPYAPSEASIEWSVATASAAEYSVMSDNEEQQRPVPPKKATKKAYNSSNGATKFRIETPKRSPSSTLLGCKSHKAVIVAGDAFITYETANTSPLVRRRSDTLAQVTTRFKASDHTKMGNFGALHGQQYAYGKPPLQRSYSTHASQLLYI